MAVRDPQQPHAESGAYGPVNAAEMSGAAPLDEAVSPEHGRRRCWIVAAAALIPRLLLLGAADLKQQAGRRSRHRLRRLQVRAGGSGWYWQRLIAELRRLGRDAIAVELSGSDPTAGFSEYRDLIITAIRAANVPVVLMAQSLGGFNASPACEQAPVRRLVLVNATIPQPDETAGEWWDGVGWQPAAQASADAEGRPAPDATDLESLFLHDLAHSVAETLRSDPHAVSEAARMFTSPGRWRIGPTYRRRSSPAATVGCPRSPCSNALPVVSARTSTGCQADTPRPQPARRGRRARRELVACRIVADEVVSARLLVVAMAVAKQTPAPIVHASPRRLEIVKVVMACRPPAGF
jgi:hypothetical protein